MQTAERFKPSPPLVSLGYYFRMELVKLREILFRGKTIINSTWAYGSFTKDSFGATFIDCVDPLGYFRVLPSTICEYTGLTDRDGRKIFEGDIVKTVRYDKFVDYWVVKFDCGTFYFDGRDYNLSPGTFDCDYSEFAEVIGNIFDNPELLGGNENETD